MIKRESQEGEGRSEDCKSNATQEQTKAKTKKEEERQSDQPAMRNSKAKRTIEGSALGMLLANQRSCDQRTSSARYIVSQISPISCDQIGSMTNL